MSWSKENVEKFIELYKNNTCMWKVKSKAYNNRNLKNLAYNELVEFCKSAVCPDANKDFVFKKIQALRGAFRKEYKKVMDSKKDCRNDDEVHQPTLWYFDMLLFTKDHDELIDSVSNADIDGYENTIESVIVDTDWSMDEEKVKETGTDQFLMKREDVVKHEESSAECKVAKRKAIEPEFTNVVQKSFKRCDEITEYEAVGINVWKKLEKMNSTQAVYAEMLISSILSKGLLNKLNDNTAVRDNS